MIYSIENKTLKVEIDTLGAQLQSIYSKLSGREYLWQGDSEFWKGRAYNLFPTIGRAFNGVYTYHKTEYAIRPHGLARYNEFTVEERSATKIVFLLTDTDETHKEYPFHFAFYVTYELKDNELCISYTVQNADDKPLIYSVGGHPGFNVPFGEGSFEDYYLEFKEPTAISQLLLSENKFMSDDSQAFPLSGGNVLFLSHDLFNDDAIVLANTCREVELKSNVDGASITFKYPDFRFLGLWHTPQKTAPFLCLEPWTALPATEGKSDDLTAKNYMDTLEKGKSRAYCYSITVNEEI